MILVVAHFLVVIASLKGLQTILDIFLAEKFQLSGGHIKNIVLSAAFLAALEDSPIGMSHLLRAAVRELKKNEIVVVREELREYADLLD